MGTPYFKKLQARIPEYRAKFNTRDKTINGNFISDKADSLQEELAPCSWAVACVFYAALAVHNTVAITANVAVAAAVWRWVGFWETVAGPGAVEESADVLRMEIVVNDIARAK